LRALLGEPFPSSSSDRFIEPQLYRAIAIELSGPAILAQRTDKSGGDPSAEA